MLERPVAALVSYGAFTLIAIFLFVKWPSTFVPDEDDGYFIAVVQLPPAASLERTQAVGKQINAILDTYPEVKIISVFPVSLSWEVNKAMRAHTLSY